jgi:acetyltransferase-like isoleucine patch superfamily enzyme
MRFTEFQRRVEFWRGADRIGPDVPLTHWRLHFKSTMRALCESKFKRFGDAAEFRPGAYAVVCSRISLGCRVVIRPGSMLFANDTGDITIEDDVMLGSGVHIYVGNHRFDDPTRAVIDQGHTLSQPVLLKRGCWVGANAIILPGVTVGENAVVGAGSVVTRDIASSVVAAGNPARIIRSVADRPTWRGPSRA